jgi:Holliday junction resolvase RusA-like endonuclease
VKAAERAIGIAYAVAGGKMIEGAVGLACAFYVRGRTSAAHLDSRDADNMLKTVKDGLQGVAYTNDRRVTVAVALKVWSATPETRIAVWSADEVDLFLRLDAVVARLLSPTLEDRSAVR